MRIYTLTKTDTQKSFSPIEVNTFVSHEEAHNTMIKQVFEYLQKCNFGVTMEELNSENGYEEGEVCVGYEYASIGTSTMLWEIFATEISLREVIIGNILSYIRETYKTPARFDDILYRLANEYKDEDLNSIKDMGDFVQEHIIGEALYQNALAELGGKNTDSAYGKILEYLNESDQFINVRCTMFNYWDLPIEEEKLEKWQRWFIGMLTICDGNKTMINLVREDIDDNQPKGEKIFIDEYKDMLCENHREKSSKLSNEAYSLFVKQICDKDAIEELKKDKDPNSYEDKTFLNWVGMLERLFEIFREEGYDRVAELNEEIRTFYFDKSLGEESPILIDTDDYQLGYFLDKFAK